MNEAVPRTVLFVCLHGANKSRLAAAFFNAVAPAGWWAASAGLHPQEAVSPHAVRLVAGTPAEPLLDRAAPVPVCAISAPALTVAIDCDVPGADRWDLPSQQVDDTMRDRLRAWATELARQVAHAG
ncbi:MAG TPA: hypothetical protein VFE14_10440 [Micromonosporaceae bacterium]|nr:hypothetical protein [Micromonosporaceae bacterium]